MREKLKTDNAKVVNNLSCFVLFFLAQKLIFHKEGSGKSLYQSFKS